MREDLLKIIKHYGEYKQLKYIHSEYFELDEAIMTNVYSENYEKHIAEEIADVMVMLRQLQYYHNIEDSLIEKVMNEKIQRQLRRIEEEK